MPTHDADAHLHRQLHRDRAILDAIAVGYAVIRHGRLIEVNDVLCGMVGFTADELIGADMPWPFWPPDDAELGSRMVRDIVAEIEETGVAQTFDVPLMRSDGTRFMAQVTCDAAREPDGSLIGWVATVSDVSMRRDHEAELERLAHHDPLTGLPNRRVFERRLEEEMADAVRHERQLAVAILDLDHFKQVNDRFGHPAGDRALKQTAERLGVVQRRGDLLARVGGEEFAWILTEVHSHGAWAAVERARHAISEEPFDEIGPLTISIGVSLRGDQREAAHIYENADQALYRAKREGRNRSILAHHI
jgi:diguanylate cyclase (GGDEF)-like protein/PAS domain S-box-containing protein